MNQLGNAIHSTNGYENSTPITEVAKNTRKTVELLDKLQCNTNPATLATLPSNILYNTNEQFIVSDTGTLTLTANTYHSVSYVVLSGTANITQSGTLLSSAPQGYSGESTATTLLTGSFIFTGLSEGSKIVITTIK